MSNNPFIHEGTSSASATTGPVPTPTAAPMPGAPKVGADAYEVDLTNVQSGFTIPDGAYKAKCIELEQSVSQSGNPMFIWTFAITEGEFAGREFKSFTALTPAAMWKVAETVEAMGVGKTGQVVKFKRSDVINRECGLLMEQQEYNGNARSSITKVISLAELAEVLNKSNNPTA